MLRAATLNLRLGAAPQLDPLTTGVFADVSFQLRRGEILGFAGLVGAGRTEVARVLFGIDRAESGEIWLKGKKVHIRSPQQAMDNGIAYVPEDRHHQGLVMNFSIAANITLPILQAVSRLGLLDPPREQRIACEYSSQLHIRSSGVEQLVNALSGGNQQKVVLSTGELAHAHHLLMMPDLLHNWQPPQDLSLHPLLCSRSGPLHCPSACKL